MAAERETPEISLVIPVYSGSRTICPLVDRIQMIFANMSFEIVLVNDGSEDDSEMLCAKLAEKFPQTVSFVNLSRNFGEHSAVLAGLSYARAVNMLRGWTTTARTRPKRFSRCWRNYNAGIMTWFTAST
jgi:glycosyltransferase involved in cell wall biosynthesis